MHLGPSVHSRGGNALSILCDVQCWGVTAMDARLWFIWITSMDQGVDHAVADEEMAAGCAENRGKYVALCGAVFLPAPTDHGPRQPCSACVRFVRARASLLDSVQRLRPPQHRKQHALVGWWTRLFRGVEPGDFGGR
jgi:hypothetical protein